MPAVETMAPTAPLLFSWLCQTPYLTRGGEQKSTIISHRRATIVDSHPALGSLEVGSNPGGS